MRRKWEQWKKNPGKDRSAHGEEARGRQHRITEKSHSSLNSVYHLLGRDPEKAMAPHSSTLAWKIPWTEEPGRLQSMGSLMVGHDWATSLSLFTFMHWRRKWQSTPGFLPGESQGQGSLVGCRLWGCTESDTRLKRLSSSSRQRPLHPFPLPSSLILQQLLYHVNFMKDL